MPAVSSLIAGGTALAGMAGGAIGSNSSTSSTSGLNLGRQQSLESALFGGKERINHTVADYKGRQGVFDSQGNRLGNTRDDMRRLRKEGKQVDYVNENAQEEFEAAQREGRAFKEIDHGTGILQTRFNELGRMVDQGPGESDIAAGLSSQRSLADLLKQMQESGGLPGREDISQANNTAGGLFNARRTSLSQSFQDQNVEAERLAARLGRPVNDPILQAKLRTGFMRQQDQLQAEQSDYANQLALSLPSQRLGYASSRADVLGGLASQAFQNRAAILSMGSQLGAADRQFRIQTAEQYGKQEGKSGGGIGGAISGGLAGLGTGLDLASKFGAGSTGFNSQTFMAQGPSAASMFPSRAPSTKSLNIYGPTERAMPNFDRNFVANPFPQIGQSFGSQFQAQNQGIFGRLHEGR